MGLITQNFGINETQRYNVAGRYLSVRGGSNLTLRLIRNNAYLSDIFAGVNAGFQYDGGDDGSEWFDAFEVTSPTAQALSIFSSLARVSDAGAVSIVNDVSTIDKNYTPVDAYAFSTVGVTSATVLAARANRRFLLVQNQGVTDLYMNYGLLPAIVGMSLKLGPGQTLLFDAICPNSQINMVSSAAGGLAVFQEGI